MSILQYLTIKYVLGKRLWYVWRNKWQHFSRHLARVSAGPTSLLSRLHYLLAYFPPLLGIPLHKITKWNGHTATNIPVLYDHNFSVLELPTEHSLSTNSLYFLDPRYRCGFFSSHMIT